MGLLEKLGNAMEKSAAKNMTGESKEEYLKEKAQKEEAAAVVAAASAPIDSVSGTYSAEELKELDKLMRKIGAVDGEGLWIGGFPNFKTGQNAVFANLLSGKKNLKFLTKNVDTYFLLKLEKGVISSYKAFSKKEVYQVEAQSKILSKSFKIKFNDNHVFTIDVTENKDKVKLMRDLLK